jgi:hypothetical protein
MKNQNAPTHSCIESLEPRSAPAGIVTLITAGGVLTLTGDGLDNTDEIVSF